MLGTRRNNPIAIFIVNIVFLLITICMRQGQTFNISPVPSFIIKEPNANLTRDENKTRSSYFGYSIVLRNQSIIIGAPRAHLTLAIEKDITEPGAIYRCPIFNDSKSIATCQPFIFNAHMSKSHNFQWFGASMDGSGKDTEKLLVCAPRFTRLKISQSEKKFSYMNGICYWSWDTLNAKPYMTSNSRLRPLDISNLQTKKRGSDNTPYYQMGEAGFSAHITPNDEEILLGAPGINIWSGSIILIGTKGNTIAYIPNNITTGYDKTYAGYAVASGYLNKTDSQNMYYIATTPHSINETGEAIILQIKFKSVSNNSATLKGTQYGEYFGYAALVVDVNGDNLSDVLITAPLHSLKLQPEVGAVYIFHYYGSFNFTRQLLKSPFAGMARFGTTISNLGDINLDGFNDIAIGAPFANDVGAVAIYLGSPEGLQQQPSQIIQFPNSSNIKLSTSMPYLFGHGLSKGVDIDENGFNDLAIGAPEFAQVFVYRSYPVVTINASLTLNPKILSTEDENDRDILIEICLNFLSKSKKLNSTMIMLYLEADPKLRRLTFNKTNTMHKTQLNITAFRENKCHAINATVKFSSSNFSTPIIMEMSYGLVFDGAIATEFCENCTVLEPNSIINFREYITYIYYCKGVPCKVDLKLESINITNTFIKDSAETLPISYRITNAGDKAYAVQIIISILPKLHFTKIPTECTWDTSSEASKLICSLENGNAFAADANTTTNLLLDVSNLNEEKEIQINATVRSYGYENKNIQKNIIKLETHTDIVIMGKPMLPYIKLNNANKTSSIESVFEIENYGPSTLANCTLTFWTPVALFNATLNKTFEIINMNKTTLKFYFNGEFMQHLSYSKHPYTMSDINFQRNTAKIYLKKAKLKPSNKTALMNCLNTDVICAESEYTVQHFAPNKKIKLKIFYNLESRLLKKHREHALDFVYLLILPSMSIKSAIRENSITIKKNNIDPIILVNLTTPKLSMWTFLIATIGGLLIFSLLTHGLATVGFFKRKKIQKFSTAQRNRQHLLNDDLFIYDEPLEH